MNIKTKKILKVFTMLIALTLFLSTPVQPTPANAAAKAPVLAKKKGTIAVGESKTIKIKNTTKVKVKKLTVKSNQEKIAKAKPVKKVSFKVTGRKAGKTTITVTVVLKKAIKVNGKKQKKFVFKYAATIKKKSTPTPEPTPTPTPEPTPDPTPEPEPETVSKTLLLSKSAEALGNEDKTGFKLTGFEEPGSAKVSYDVDMADLDLSEEITDPAAELLAGDLVTLGVTGEGKVLSLVHGTSVGYTGTTYFSNNLAELEGKPIAGTTPVYLAKVPSEAENYSGIVSGYGPESLDITTWGEFNGTMSATDAANRGLVRIYQDDDKCTAVVVFSTGSNLSYLNPIPIEVIGGGGGGVGTETVTVVVTEKDIYNGHLRYLNVFDAAGPNSEPLYNGGFESISESIDPERVILGKIYTLTVSGDERKVTGITPAGNTELDGTTLDSVSGEAFKITVSDDQAQTVEYDIVEKPLIVIMNSDGTWERFTNPVTLSNYLDKHIFAAKFDSPQSRRIAVIVIFNTQ